MISEVFSNFKDSVISITTGKASRGNTAPQKGGAGAAGPQAEAQAHVGGVLLSSRLLEIPEWEERCISMFLPGPRKILSGLEVPKEPCLSPWSKTSLVL